MSGLAFPKVTRRRPAKAKSTRPSRLARIRKRQERAAIIKETRRLVFQRDAQCRCCYAWETTWAPDEMHEIVSRAKLRGRPPREIFNTKNCVRLCRECHHKATAGRLLIVPATKAGANGRLVFTTKADALWR